MSLFSRFRSHETEQDEGVTAFAVRHNPFANYLAIKAAMEDPYFNISSTCTHAHDEDGGYYDIITVTSGDYTSQRIINENEEVLSSTDLSGISLTKDYAWDTTDELWCGVLGMYAKRALHQVKGDYQEFLETTNIDFTPIEYIQQRCDITAFEIEKLFPSADDKNTFSDYMLEQIRRPPRTSSTFSKVLKFAGVMGIALVTLGALAPLAAADDWPYEDLDAVGYDSLDVFGDLSNGATYYAGNNVTINAVARSDYEDAVVVEVYAPGSDTPLASKEFGPIPGTTLQFDVQLAPDAPQGLYRIDTNGIPTDHFTVAEYWPYPNWNAVSYDAPDVFGDLTDGALYPPGQNVTINTTARSDNDGNVSTKILDPYEQVIACENFTNIAGTTQQFNVTLAPNATAGQYGIFTDNNLTDKFTVSGPVLPVDEEPPIVLTTIGLIVMALGYLGYERIEKRYKKRY